MTGIKSLWMCWEEVAEMMLMEGEKISFTILGEVREIFVIAIDGVILISGFNANLRL